MGIVKKAYNKVKKFAKKRYVNKKGIKLVQVAKDVMMLKNVLNPEKKRLNTFVNYRPAAQVYNSSNGMNTAGSIIDITPVLPVGTGYSDRNGASVKLHSTHMRFQFLQQFDTNNAIRVKIVIIQVKGSPITTGLQAYCESILQPNPFVQSSTAGVVCTDYFSQFNPDKFSTFNIIAQKKFTVLNDAISAQNMTKDVSIGIKYNRGKGTHLRWDKNSSTLTNGQLIMMVLCDRGNCGSAVGTNWSGNLDNIADSGLLFQYNKMDYYYDN